MGKNMSLDATIWAWKQDIRPLEKLVLLSLADRADEFNVCFPSLTRLCSDTGLARSSVVKFIEALEESGRLLKIAVRRHDNGYSHNLYQLVGVVNREGDELREFDENAKGLRFVLPDGSKRPVADYPSTPHELGASTPHELALVRGTDSNLSNKSLKSESIETDESAIGNAERGTVADATAPRDQKTEKSQAAKKEKREAPQRRLYQSNINLDTHPYTWEALDGLNRIARKNPASGLAVDKRRGELTVNPSHLDTIESNLSMLGDYADDSDEHQFVLRNLIGIYNKRIADRQHDPVNLAWLAGVNMPWMDGEMDAYAYADWVLNFVMVD